MANTKTEIYLRLNPAPDAPETAIRDALLEAISTRKPACVRLFTTSEALAKALTALCHAQDLPLVIEGEQDTAIAIAHASGADGVHLDDAPGLVKDARAALGKDAIIGIATGDERHAAMSAAEAGADYVALSPEWQGDSVPDFIRFWAEAIEIPAVVENAPSDAARAALDGIADFIALDVALG